MSRVEVSFGGQTGDLEGAIRELTSEFKTLFNALKAESKQAAGVVDGEMDKIVDDMKRVEREGQNMTAMFGKIKGSLAGLAAGFGLTQIAGYVVKTSIEFERLRSTLQTLEGDAAGARFESLKQFAAETPYDLQQVVTAFTRLKSLGLDPGNEALRSYGNTASSMGKSMEQMIEAVADATTGEFERLKEFGIRARQQGEQVTFTFQGVSTTVGKNSQEISDYLKSIGETQFAGAMERQMDTLGGAFSNLMDTVATTADQIGQGGLSEALNTIAKELVSATEGSTSWADVLGGVLGQAIMAVWEIVQGFGFVFQQVMAVVGDLMNAVAGTTQDSSKTMGSALQWVMALVNGFGVGVRVVMTAVAAIVRAAASSFITFANIVNQVFRFDFSGAMASFRKWGSDMSGLAKDTAGAIVDSLAEGKKRQDKIFAAPPPKAKAVPLPGFTPAPAAPPPPKKGGGAGGGSGASAEAEAKRKREEELQAELDALQLLEDAARDNTQELLRLQDLKLAAVKRVHGEESREYRQAHREKLRMERDYVQEQIALAREATEHKLRLAQIGADSENQIAMAGLDARREAIENAADQGLMNPEERSQALAALLNEEFELERAHEERLFQLKSQAIKDQLALDGLREPEKRRLLAELEIMETEHNAKMSQMAVERQNQITRFNNETQRNVRQQWQQALQPIGQAFNGLMQGMLQGTTSFKQGYIQMMDQLVSGFLSRLVEMGVNWLAMELTKTGATQTQEAIRMATTTSAAATSTAAAATAGTTQVATNAAVGASGAFASVAQIPVIGPFIAPAIAAGAMAAIMGFGRLISARGGADIGSGVNPLAQLHEEEMVLPAHIANPLRSMLAGPRTSNLAANAGNAGAQMREAMVSSRGGDSNFYYQPNNNLSDAKFEEMLRRDGRQMRKWLKNEMRNGNLKMNAA